MRAADMEIMLERAKENYPEGRPRVISENGPQFSARDFREFIRISGMTHVRTSPSNPQSNERIEQSNGGTNRTKTGVSDRARRRRRRMRGDSRGVVRRDSRP